MRTQAIFIALLPLAFHSYYACAYHFASPAILYHMFLLFLFLTIGYACILYYKHAKN